MFLDEDFRGEGEPQEPTPPRVSNAKIAILLALIPSFVLSAMIGAFAIQIGYVAIGCSCIGAAIISIQQFISRGIDVLFSLHSRKTDS